MIAGLLDRLFLSPARETGVHQWEILRYCAVGTICLRSMLTVHR
jgi:hypothetical protein